jgi:hypothetical protein
VSGDLAATNSGFVIVYNLGGYATGALWDASLGSSTPLSLSGYNPSVGAGPNGFAVASVLPTSPPEITLFSSTGAKLCGPVPFAQGGFSPSGIAPSTRGYVVLDHASRVAEVFSDCSLGQTFSIDSSSARNARIAGGLFGYGVVWTNAGVPKFRTFGPKFCN